MNFLEDPTKELLIQNVHKLWPRHMDVPVIKPGPVLTFPYPAYVPCDKQVLYHTGMKGWFHPEKRLFFHVTFRDSRVNFIAMGLWDSHPEGRVGQIIQRSPRAQHAFLRNYFLQFDVFRCHLAKVTVPGQVDHAAEVMQTRYMDNAYVALGNAHTRIHAQLELFLEIFHHTIYDIQVPTHCPPS